MVKKLLSLILVFLLINGSGSISTAASGVGRILKVIEFENGNPLSKPCEVETEENTVVVEKDSEKKLKCFKNKPEKRLCFCTAIHFITPCKTYFKCRYEI